MGNIYHVKQHWLGRVRASDPGRKRLQKAGKATLSLIFSVFTMLFILHIAGFEQITPAIVAGMVGLVSIMVVMDETTQEKKVTTLLMSLSAILGITLGSLASVNPYYVGVLMISVIFSAFFFSQFRVRYFSFGMIGFFTVYISSFLKLNIVELPWFYLGIALGIMYAYLFNFLVFKDSATILKRGMRSFHIQANLTFNMMITIIQQPNISEKRKNRLEKNIKILRAYARNVSEDLDQQDVKEIWPGLKASQLRLYVFDTAMLVETLGDSINKLKNQDALETQELRRLLLWIVRSLREAEVLATDYDPQNLEEAEKAVQALRLALNEFLDNREEPQKWLYLIRRIESIVNHVIEGATRIQHSLHKWDGEIEEPDSTEENEDEEVSEEEGMNAATKKAIQALVACSLSIVLGYIISPIQPYWIVLTSFIVLLGTESVGRTYIKGMERSIGTVIGAVFGFMLANLVSGRAALEITLLFIVVFFAFYLLTVSYTSTSLFITMLIAFLYDILLGGISIELLGARVIDTIVGSALALGAAAFILPTKTKDKVSEGFSLYLEELQSYLLKYVKRFREDTDVKGLSSLAFSMDQQLQTIRVDAQSLVERPSFLRYANLSRYITVFTAIHYYAQHLVASSYQKNFESVDELEDVFISMEEKLQNNTDTLSKLMQGEERSGIVYTLFDEREKVERVAPSRWTAKRDLIHHLYYIWKINQSIVVLAEGLGADVQDHKEKSYHDS
ncbi:FUSC family protein [Pontibacillus marinus]|uniref:Integral membrane bound transporter domain-containing protein n=1 Tax=Pontibacillus marinus BH030004 = DSM 16465 TaxID=1385511 RepID=A0A0A5FY35_9BACI|nr:FUSC family protein [Pontibacillus marinus]KGX84704.1 hypothetical protein N783_16195 [Pontibacillus marinus BH030004 = DSM 16465]